VTDEASYRRCGLYQPSARVTDRQGVGSVAYDDHIPYAAIQRGYNNPKGYYPRWSNHLVNAIRTNELGTGPHRETHFCRIG
jgi:hypothetical protein